MRFEGPIDIRPLTMRGTFGIAWRLVKRNFASLFFYALLMQLILVLGVFVVFSPLLGTIIKGGFDELDFAIEILVAVLLMFVYVLAVVLLFNPIYAGTLYGELSARIYADGVSTGMLLHRTKFSLKRFFTTAMCLIVCGIVISIAQSIVSSMSGGVFGVAGFAAMLPSSLMRGAWNGSFSGTFDGSFNSALGFLSGMSAGLVILFLLMSLLSFGITLCGQTFICFTYPVAANESVFNFDAVGRSLKLTSKRFGRVFGAKLLYSLIFLGIEVVLGAIIALVLVLAMDFETVGIAPWGYPFLGVLALASLFVSVLASVYVPALDTVLYYDARTRVEGRAWLGMDQPGAQAQNAPQPGDETHYEVPTEPQPQNDQNENGGEYGA